MFLKNTVYFYFLVALTAGIIACKKAPVYPKEPVIEFKELKLVSTPAILTDSVFLLIKFKDGDGDLGNDPTGDIDFFIELYKKKNGNFVSINSFLPSYNASLPLLSPYTAVGPIDGTITYKVDPYIKNRPLKDTSKVLGYPNLFGQGDTLRYRIRVKDRANNYSNWVESTDYIVWKNL